jgi:transposase
MRAYSMDLRARVLADCDAGLGTAGVAAKYRVSEAWVRRVKQCRRETGRVGPRPPSPGRPRKLAAHEARLRELVAADPDATLAELRDLLGVRVSLSTLAVCLDRLRLSFKKKSSGRPSRTGRT